MLEAQEQDCRTGTSHRFSSECCWAPVLLSSVCDYFDATCVKLKIRTYPPTAGAVKEQETSHRVTGGRAKGSSAAKQG